MIKEKTPGSFGIVGTILVVLRCFPRRGDRC